MKIDAQKVAELNAKRTQGEYSIIHSTNIMTPSGRCVAQTGGYSSNITGDNWFEENQANAAFIAAAPAMALLIAQQAAELEALHNNLNIAHAEIADQQEELEALRGALERLRDDKLSRALDIWGEDYQLAQAIIRDGLITIESALQANKGA